MHHALHIAELHTMVLESCDEQSLASMARVCRELRKLAVGCSSIMELSLLGGLVDHVPGRCIWQRYPREICELLYRSHFEQCQSWHDRLNRTPWSS